jgi:hypothetical protein
MLRSEIPAPHIKLEGIRKMWKPHKLDSIVRSNGWPLYLVQ